MYKKPRQFLPGLLRLANFTNERIIQQYQHLQHGKLYHK